MKKIIVLFLSIVLYMGLAGCSKKEEPEDWKSKYTAYPLEHLTIYLPSDLKLSDLQESGWTFAMEGEELVVLANRETNELLGSYGLTFNSLKEYAETATTGVEGTLTDMKTYYQFEYIYTESQLYYAVGIYKTTDGYWLVNFCCEASNQTKYEAQFKDWLSKVEFD